MHNRLITSGKFARSAVGGILIAVAATALIRLTLLKPSSSISGGCWIQRRNGDSVIQRGVSVGLFAPTVPGASIQIELQKAALDLKGKIMRLRGEHVFASDFEANKLAEKVAAIPSLMREATGDVSLDVAARISAAINESGSPHVTVFDTQRLQTTTTDVEGKFVFENVPKGRYFLVATEVNDAFVATWVVPVTSSDSAIHVDLFNGDATYLYNLLQ
jgi:hypothetical protein